MSYNRYDLFQNLDIKTCTDLDIFLDRIKNISSQSGRAALQSALMAMSILDKVANANDTGLLDQIIATLGYWNDSEVFILEKRLNMREIVQAGFLPQGCTITFENKSDV